jgi:MFS family permease
LKRYKVLAAAILIELLFGFQYTWAIFDRILQDKHGISASATQFVFSSAIVCFAGGMVFAAKIMNRIGPRASMRLGAAVYGAGLVVAGAGGARIGTLVLGAGMMMGGG